MLTDAVPVHPDQDAFWESWRHLLTAADRGNLGDSRLDETLPCYHLNEGQDGGVGWG